MYIKAQVVAGSRKESFVEEGHARFLIAVREKAAANAANKRVVALIAEHLGVPVKAVRIVNGHHSPSKILDVDDRAL